MVKHIIASIKKNKFIGIIFIFQIVISILGLSQISYYNNHLNLYENNVDKLNINPNTMYSTKYTGGAFKYDINNGFIEDLTKLLGKDTLGISMYSTLYIEKMKNKDEYNKRLYEVNPYIQEDNGEDAIDNFKISSSIFKLIDINIVKGRNFIEEDFYNTSNKYTPILVSEDFKDLIKIGDKIKTSSLDNYIENFEVIGFFDNKLKWASIDFIHSGLKNLNGSFISPYIYTKNNKHNIDLFSNLFLFNNTDMNNDQFKNTINNIASKNNITIYTESVKETLDKIEKENKNSIISTTIIGIILIIFTLFSIGIVSFYSMKYRKSEIGILKIVGIKTNKIKTIIIIEWSVYMVISLIISLILAINSNKVNTEFLKENIDSVNNLANISYLSILLIWLILFILVLSVVYFSISKIINKQVTDLIKGVE